MSRCTYRVHLFPQPEIWICTVYPLQPPAVWTCRFYPFHHQQYRVQVVSLSTGSNMNVQGVPLFIPQHCKGAGCIPFNHQQYGLAGFIPFTISSIDVQVVSLSTGRVYPFLSPSSVRVYPSPLLAVWMSRVYVSHFTFVKCSLNAGTPDCPAYGQSGTGMNKNALAGTTPVLELADTRLRYRMPECRCISLNADAQL